MRNPRLHRNYLKSGEPKKRPVWEYVPCKKCGYPVAWQHGHSKIWKKYGQLSFDQQLAYLRWLTREAKKGDLRAIALVPGGENL